MRVTSSLRHVIVVAASCGAALSPPRAAAQGVFGGVQGTVRDSLGPAAGVRVTLAGTTFTAVTGIAGEFAVDHVPAGIYVVRAERSAQGGAAGEVEGVRVASDATATVDVRLGERREAAGEAVAGDLLSTRAVWSTRALGALPVDDSRQAVALMPGVVARGTDLGVGAGPALAIRGSLADQTAVFVDGAPARFETLGASALALPTPGILEASLLTGAAPASVPEARGAAVAYVTRAGGPRLEAGLTAGTDGPFSKSATVGFDHFEAFAGGPVPHAERLTWFVSGALLGQSSLYRGRGADTVPTFALAGVDTVVNYTYGDPGSPGGVAAATAVVPRFAQVSGSCGQLGGDSRAAAQQIRRNYGLACQGLRQSFDWATSRRAQAKLLYSYGDGSSLSLSGLASDFQQRDPAGTALADNAMFTGTRVASALAVLTWSHRLQQLRSGAVRLEAGLWAGSDHYQSGPLDLSSELATEDPALGIELSRLRFAGLDGIPLPLTDAAIRQMRTDAFRPPLWGRDDLTPEAQFRFNPYGVSNVFPTTGVSGELTVVSETRLGGRVGVEWDVNADLVVRGGADFSRTDLSYYDAPLVPDVDVNGVLAHPSRSGLFAEARYDAGALTLEGGLRADRYASGSDFPVYPGRIFSNPAWTTGDTSYAARVARVFAPGRTQTLATPTLRVGFRVDDRTVARAALSQRVELPPYAWLYSNVNADLADNVQGGPFGRDISYVKSALIEVGLRHVFPSGLALDGSAYEKTHLLPYALASANVYDPYVGGTPGQPNESLTLLTATAGTRAMGADFGVEWGAGGPIGGTASYALEQTRLPEPGTYPVASGPITVTTQVVVGTLSLRVPDGWAAGPVLGPALRGVGAVIVGRATSGEPYTPVTNDGSGVVAPPSNFILTMAGWATVDHLPWTRTLDLRVTKAVEVRGARISVYAEARNLLNLDNLVALFAETGRDANPLYRANVLVPQISSLEQDAGSLWVQKPVTAGGVTQMLYGVDLTNCASYPQGFGGSRGVVDCVALRQVEARWGNGDGFYDTNEIARALGAWYDSFAGAWRFHAPARTARIGVAVEF